MSPIYWSSIINAIRNPLGLSSLVILVIAYLALTFFPNDSVRVRLGIFLFIAALCSALYIHAVQVVSPPPGSDLPSCDVVLFGPCSD